MAADGLRPLTTTAVGKLTSCFPVDTSEQLFPFELVWSAGMDSLPLPAQTQIALPNNDDDRRTLKKNHGADASSSLGVHCTAEQSGEDEEAIFAAKLRAIYLASRTTSNSISISANDNNSRDAVTTKGNKSCNSRTNDTSCSCGMMNGTTTNACSTSEQVNAANHDILGGLVVLPAGAVLPGGGGGPPQTFPRKIMDMLRTEDPNVVGWVPSGTSFVIRDADTFVQQILPKYFRHGRMTSFQRQLNLYGFKRICNKGPEAGAYYHDLFLRDQQDLCHQMKRLPAKSDGSQQSSSLTRSTANHRRPRSSSTSEANINNNNNHNNNKQSNSYNPFSSTTITPELGPSPSLESIPLHHCDYSANAPPLHLPPTCNNNGKDEEKLGYDNSSSHRKSSLETVTSATRVMSMTTQHLSNKANGITNASMLLSTTDLSMLLSSPPRRPATHFVSSSILLGYTTEEDDPLSPRSKEEQERHSSALAAAGLVADSLRRHNLLFPTSPPPFLTDDNDSTATTTTSASSSHHQPVPYPLCHAPQSADSTGATTAHGNSSYEDIDLDIMTIMFE